jgi:hypothetical protein
MQNLVSIQQSGDRLVSCSNQYTHHICCCHSLYGYFHDKNLNMGYKFSFHACTKFCVSTGSLQMQDGSKVTNIIFQINNFNFSLYLSLSSHRFFQTLSSPCQEDPNTIPFSQTVISGRFLHLGSILHTSQL